MKFFFDVICKKKKLSEYWLVSPTNDVEKKYIYIYIVAWEEMERKDEKIWDEN